MALVSLLIVPSDQRSAIGFVFDHDQLHRSMTDAQIQANSSKGGTNTSGSRPFLLDPATVAAVTRRAGNWHFDHQNAHDNFNVAIFGTRFGQNLADSNLVEPASLAWWTFVNHQEHYLDNKIP